MAISNARRTANKKYDAKTYERLVLELRRDSTVNRDTIRAHAEMRGESVNGFIKRAVAETIERDNKSPFE